MPGAHAASTTSRVQRAPAASGTTQRGPPIVDTQVSPVSQASPTSRHGPLRDPSGRQRRSMHTPPQVCVGSVSSQIPSKGSGRTQRPTGPREHASPASQAVGSARHAPPSAPGAVQRPCVDAPSAVRPHTRPAAQVCATSEQREPAASASTQRDVVRSHARPSPQRARGDDAQRPPRVAIEGSTTHTAWSYARPHARPASQGVDDARHRPPAAPSRAHRSPAAPITQRSPLGHTPDRRAFCSHGAPDERAR